MNILNEMYGNVVNDIPIPVDKDKAVQDQLDKLNKRILELMQEHIIMKKEINQLTKKVNRIHDLEKHISDFKRKLR